MNLDKIERYEQDYISKQGYKYYILFLISIATGLMLYFWFIPLVDFLTLTSEPNSVLSEKIDSFIPEISADKAISDDFLITTWEMNNREPYIFHKNSVLDEPEKYGDFDKLNLMTFLSAVNPLYFLPFKSGTDKVFISGNAAAESPAMFAYLYATEYGQAPEDIEVVSIGSLEERPNKIPSDIGVLEWTARLSSLQGPVKSYAQDYILEAILLNYGSNLWKFTYPIPIAQEEELAAKMERIEDIVDLKSDFINEQRFMVEVLLKEIVDDKVPSECPSE